MTYSNIVEYADKCLNTPLFPVQKVILKAAYGIPLDDTTPFTITDWRRDLSRQFTEKTYLERLWGMGRSNIREVVPGEVRREMVLCLGRRTGKDWMTQLIAAWELRGLLEDTNPPLFRAGSRFQMVFVQLSKSTDWVSQICQQDEVLRQHSQQDLTFKTSGQQNPSTVGFRFISYKAQQKSLHAQSSTLVAFEEPAHSGRDEDVYRALAPTTVGTRTGGKCGKVLLFSSPHERAGLFYNLFQLGMKEAPANLLCIQAPTWEVNPILPASEFQKHYDRDPVMFAKEFGAEWGQG